mmetsp:Transcript_95873/g.299041  ORF Transcript_95873/g.299041 Transcript_95873/m.299041 type:complete len:84 (+) Transcript_95873:200-451(+)
MICKHNIFPSLSTVDCKSTVFTVSTIDNIATYKIRHCLSCSWAERILSCFCWLEKNIGVSISIKLSCCLCCCTNIVTLFKIRL